MAVYTIGAPDGKGTIDLEFDNKMSSEQVQAYLNSKEGQDAVVNAYNPQAPAQPEPSMWESAKESVTGNQRTTPEIEQMDRVDLMPELNDWSLKNVGYSLRTMLTNPKETAEVIKSNYPEVQIRQDPKGNYVFKSARDGKEYAIKPGLGITDVIGGAAGAALGYTGATLAAPLAAMAGGGYTGAAITGAASQFPIELAKLPGGGSVSPMDMALSTALGPALHGAGSILRTAKNAILPPSASAQAAQVVSAPSSAFTAERQALQEQLERQHTAEIAAYNSAQQAAIQQSAEQHAAELAAQQLAIKQAAEQQTSLIKSIGEAASEGPRSFQNRAEQLKSMVDVDREAVRAASELGVANDIPVGVFSRNAQLKNIEGALASQVGSEAEAANEIMIKKVADKFGKKFEELGALQEGGGPSAAVASYNVRKQLEKESEKLKVPAVEFYDKLKETISPTARVSYPNLKAKIAELDNSLASDADAYIGDLRELVASGEPRPLVTNSTIQPSTYRQLMNRKTELREAVGRTSVKYGHIPQNIIKELESALKEDQVYNVGRIAGPKAATDLVEANKKYAQHIDLENKLDKHFGMKAKGFNEAGEPVEYQRTGSIAGDLIQSVRRAANPRAQDVSAFNDIINDVPKAMRGEVILTALGAATTAGGGKLKGGFGFSEFSDLYRNLMRNPEALHQVQAAIGNDKLKVLNSMHLVSKHITDTRARVLPTGKANQILGEIAANNLITKVISNPIVSSVFAMGQMIPGVKATTKIAQGVPVVKNAVNFSSDAEKRTLKAFSDFMNAQELRDLIAEGIQKGMASDRAVKRLAISKAFANYAKEIKLPMTDAEKWIQSGLKTTNLESDKK